MFKTRTIMKSLILSILSIMITQCSFFMDDDSLSIPLTPYTGDQLRIDGYYYLIGYDGKTIHSAYFFYGNGVLISCNGAKSSLEEMDNYIKEEFLDSQIYKRRKIDWGVFLIEGNNIKFERWYPSQRPYPAFVREGVVLNNTTFHITKSYRSNGTEEREKDEIYYFRPFSPKPDSTNNFIK